MHALSSGSLPPTVSVAYSVSKVAVNALTLEMAKAEEKIEGGEKRVRFHVANPGHCKTSLNGFRGERDPFEGARVVEEVVYREGEEMVGEEKGVGFWVWEGDEEGRMGRVEW